MSSPTASSSIGGAGGTKRKFDSNPSSSSSSSAPQSNDFKKTKYSSSDKKGAPRPGGDATKWKSKKEWEAGKPKAYTRQERKVQQKVRKASKPNADIIAEANKVWQQSFATMSSHERTGHIDSLLTHMSGKMLEIGLKHDASRAIQIAIKYANEEQKYRIIKELTGHFRQLSEEHYGHYIIIKLLANDTRKGAAKAVCLKEFRSHMQKLSMQPDSGKVFDYLYASSKQKDQNMILQEFYSPEFVVFAETDQEIQGKNLTEILVLRPEKKSQILDNLRKYLDKAFEKNMFLFRFIHSLLLQYLTHMNFESHDHEFLTNLYQHIPALHHSEDGCRIICHMLSTGSAKDRKNILKYFKGIVGNMAERQEGVWVITCALDVVDDTVLLEKVVLSELLPTLQDQILHQYSSRIYMHILNSNDASLFAPGEKGNYSVSGKWVLNSNALPAAAASSSSSTTSTATPAPMLSKKDPAMKRLELLNTFLLPLLTSLATLPDVLNATLRSNTGHHLLLESMREAWRLTHDAEAKAAASAAPAPAEKAGKKKGGKTVVKDEDAEESKENTEDAAPAAAQQGGARFPPALAKKLTDLETQLGYLFDAISKECTESFGAASTFSKAAASVKGANSNPLEDRFGHYVIKRLLAFEPTPNEFVTKVLDAVSKDAAHLHQCATTNRPAFVLSVILEKSLAVHADRLKKMLKPLVKDMTQTGASKPTPIVKDEEMKDASSSSNKYQKKNAPVYNAHSTTNAGVDLLSKLVQGLPTEKHAATAVDHKPVRSSSTSSLGSATPGTPSRQSSRIAKKKAATVDPIEETSMETDDAVSSMKTPAKKPATAKKATKASTRKTTAKKKGGDEDAMEE